MIIQFTPYQTTTLTKMDVLPKTFVQIILASKWLVRHLPSLLSLSVCDSSERPHLLSSHLSEICVVLGCLCIYSDSGSLEYIRSSLETTLLLNLEKEDRLLPLIILFQPANNIGDKELLFLQTEGIQWTLTVSRDKYSILVFFYIFHFQNASNC